MKLFFTHIAAVSLHLYGIAVSLANCCFLKEVHLLLWYSLLLLLLFFVCLCFFHINIFRFSDLTKLT